MIVVHGTPIADNKYQGKEKVYYSHDVLVEHAFYGDRPSLLRIGVPDGTLFAKVQPFTYKVFILAKNLVFDAYEASLTRGCKKDCVNGRRDFRG